MRTDRTYISSLGKFIETDFLNFRLVNADSTIGGMIVCSSNPQARKVKEWFDKNVSTLETGLVISDEDAPRSDINKETQKAFRKTLKPDILIVHQMLTTGYDVPRLKKMYLLRNAKEHTLLQTISRVNRPYKNPKTGKVYQYGYIVDFVDIERNMTVPSKCTSRRWRTISTMTPMSISLWLVWSSALRISTKVSRIPSPHEHFG